MNKNYDALVEICRESARLCKMCAAAVISSGGETECEKTCLDCAAICELCVTLGESKSMFFEQAIQLCVDVCMNCVAVCEENGCESCMKCALQCRLCTVECLSIID